MIHCVIQYALLHLCCLIFVLLFSNVQIHMTVNDKSTYTFWVETFFKLINSTEYESNASLNTLNNVGVITYQQASAIITFDYNSNYLHG